MTFIFCWHLLCLLFTTGLFCKTWACHFSQCQGGTFQNGTTATIICQFGIDLSNYIVDEVALQTSDLKGLHRTPVNCPYDNGEYKCSRSPRFTVAGKISENLTIHVVGVNFSDAGIYQCVILQRHDLTKAIVTWKEDNCSVIVTGVDSPNQEQTTPPLSCPPCPADTSATSSTPKTTTTRTPTSTTITTPLPTEQADTPTCWIALTFISFFCLLFITSTIVLFKKYRVWHDFCCWASASLPNLNIDALQPLQPMNNRPN